MGSQWAPILCSAVALQREWNFFRTYRTLLTEPHLHHRYVDNRLLILPHGHLHCDSIRLFWTLDFYTAPILLEHVPGKEALGFAVDPLQSTITFQQPWNRSLRSSRNSGPRSAVLSGLYARLRLILTNTYPRELQLSQIQDLLGSVHCLDPTLFPFSERQAVMSFLPKFHRHLRIQDVFAFC